MSVLSLSITEWIYSAYNDLSGSIPTEIGQVTNLTVLNFHFTALTGTLPTELGRLTNLLEIGHWGTLISGTIPEEIYLSGNEVINALVLAASMLSGSISRKLGG